MKHILLKAGLGVDSMCNDIIIMSLLKDSLVHGPGNEAKFEAE